MNTAPETYEERLAEWEGLEDDREAEALLQADAAITRGDFKDAHRWLERIADSDDADVQREVAARLAALQPDPAVWWVLVGALVVLAAVLWALYTPH